MSDAAGLEALFDPIRKAMADMEAERLRYGHIAAFIRVNALRHGATDDQVEDFLHGRADFIAWLADKIERPAPTLADALALPQIAAMERSLEKLYHAVCGQTGFAECVRRDSGKEYPWPALDEADMEARAALAAVKGGAK